MCKSSLFVFVLAAQCSFAQQATVVKFDRLQALMETKSDQIQIINFWATWCAPCVKELPLFESINAKNDPTVKITLINLDYADKLAKVNAFLSRKDMKSEVLLLDEIDYNSWIDRVDESWGGAIPATLFINQKTGQRKFVGKELKEGQLEELILELKK
jgi:thiol-disulfide isomerase/thioredoxin